MTEMTEKAKYITDYSWRTIVRNVIVLSATTYRVSVSPIDSGDPGALLPITTKMLLVDNAGHLFPIIAAGTGTIDVEDILLCGECPASGFTGIVCKTANKGNALYLPQGLLNYLDKSAKPYLDSVTWSILWANDPNPRRIAFKDAEQISISDYRTNITDTDGNTFNPVEDYPQPKFEIWLKTSDTTYSKLPINPEITISEIDGLIDSVTWGTIGTSMTGYIVISK
jgi:hypothetical protein